MRHIACGFAAGALAAGVIWLAGFDFNERGANAVFTAVIVAILFVVGAMLSRDFK